jgi:hypothetical protein
LVDWQRISGKMRDHRQAEVAVQTAAEIIDGGLETRVLPTKTLHDPVD